MKIKFKNLKENYLSLLEENKLLLKEKEELQQKIENMNGDNLQNQIKLLEEKNRAQSEKIIEMEKKLVDEKYENENNEVKGDNNNDINDNDKIYDLPVQVDAVKIIKNKKQKKEKNNKNLINENIELKNIIEDLKNEINELKQNNTNIDNNNNQNEDIILQLNEKIMEKDMIIEELSEEYNKLDHEYKLSFQENITLQNHISKLEQNLGIDEQINNLKSIISEKEKLIIDYSEQIKEYQSQCDDIILGNTQEEKDEQIKKLLNEVKAIRSRLLNIISFQGRINDFEEFLEVINKIKDYIYKSKDSKILQSYEKLNLLVENYELNGQKYYNKLIQEIFGINYFEDENEDNANINDNININNNEEQNYINNENGENINNYENQNIEYNNNEINDDYQNNIDVNYQDNNEEK